MTCIESCIKTEFMSKTKFIEIVLCYKQSLKNPKKLASYKPYAMITVQLITIKGVT